MSKMSFAISLTIKKRLKEFMPGTFFQGIATKLLQNKPKNKELELGSSYCPDRSVIQ